MDGHGGQLESGQTGRSDEARASGAPQAGRDVRARTRAAGRWRAYVTSLGLVFAASLVSAAAHLVVSPGNLAMFYLAAVVVAALYLGRGPAVLAAVTGVLALDVLFVPPRLTLSVADTEYLLTFVGLFVVGLIVSSLAAKARDQAHEAEQRERETRTLYEFSRDLATVSGLDGILPVIVEHVRGALGCRAVVLLGHDDELSPARAHPDPALAPQELAAARRAYEDRSPTESTGGANGRCLRFVPLVTARGVPGVLGVLWEPDGASKPLDRRLLDVFASVAALAVERAQLAEQARQAQVLQATEKLQSALLDSISHDLRTPLVTITGAITALDDDARADRPSGAGVSRLEEAAKRGLLAVAREESERLDRLVGDLLDVTRLEAGALRVAVAPVDVDELVGTALERLGRRLAGRDVNVAVADDVPLVPLDAPLMVHVLSNLLDNAAKHSPQGASIDVRAEPSPAGLRITVADRGPGVPEAELDHIFEKFHRIQRPGGPSGTGLGLAVCRGIVEAHGGTIGARNRRDGGLEVVVTIPEEASVGAVRAGCGGGRASGDGPGGATP